MLNIEPIMNYTQACAEPSLEYTTAETGLALLLAVALSALPLGMILLGTG